MKFMKNWYILGFRLQDVTALIFLNLPTRYPALYPLIPPRDSEQALATDDPAFLVLSDFNTVFAMRDVKNFTPVHESPFGLIICYR